jgi:hypothetical protein
MYNEKLLAANIAVEVNHMYICIIHEDFFSKGKNFHVFNIPLFSLNEYLNSIADKKKKYKNLI